MHHKKIIPLVFFLAFFCSFQLSKKRIKLLENNEILTVTKIRSQKKKTQIINFSTQGLHKKNCNFALKKISQYENYDKYLSFIAKSQYNKKTNNWLLKFNHYLMPYKFSLYFKMPRIQKEGTYPFLFKVGFLQGLKGTVRVSQYKKRCLFQISSNWKGPHTNIPNAIFKLFLNTVSEIGIKTLFRISSIL